MYTAVFSKRISEEVVDRIRGLIMSEQLRPGDRLPSERTLAASMGVGRVTIREAMRVLEANGVVEIRVGARGGAVVTSPSLSRIGARLADLIGLSAMTPGEVTAARQVLEVGIIPVVVDRITNGDISELRDMVALHHSASTAGEYGLDMSTTFHVRVATCTHNRAIEVLTYSLYGTPPVSPREADLAAPLKSACDTAEHRDFVEAIAARDVSLAEDIMRAHLDRSPRFQRPVHETETDKT
jgi:GntR family transcriptional regulator, transcriptional repressor for pyruvate dehydrogenase complex